MRIFIMIALVILLSVMPAVAQTSENASNRPLLIAVKVAQQQLLADQAAIDAAQQAFKTALAQIRADEASGNTAAMEASQPKLEELRVQLQAARKKMQDHQQQFRKDAAALITADEAAIEEARDKLMQDKASGNADALAADEAVLQKAMDQAQADRYVTEGIEPPKETPEVAKEPPPPEEPQIEIISGHSRSKKATPKQGSFSKKTSSGTTTSKKSSSKKSPGKSGSTLKK